MSSCSQTEVCHKCGGQLETSEGSCAEDNYGECLHCGYAYGMKEWKNTLKTVNETRSVYGLRPIKKLRKQKEVKYGI